ncbi:MAG: hypothetical protein IPN01_29210 [Deltaproteobacteria bacterium]|nr:hypothetical protein [Deltaproteobacteria bacterium]
MAPSPRLSRRAFFCGAAALAVASAVPGDAGATTLSTSAIQALLDADGGWTPSTPTRTASRSTKSL